MVSEGEIWVCFCCSGTRDWLPAPPTAEQYKSEDEAATARITAKNGLETYAYNLRNSVEGDLKDKLDAADKEALDKAITETISWLDASAEASTDEYSEKQKELEAVANPIVRSPSSPSPLPRTDVPPPRRWPRLTELQVHPEEELPRLVPVEDSLVLDRTSLPSRRSINLVTPE
jgi:hypothetical protein